MARTTHSFPAFPTLTVPFLNFPHLPVVHDQQEALPTPLGNSQFSWPLTYLRENFHLRLIIMHAPSFKTMEVSSHSPSVEEPPPLVGQQKPLTINDHLFSPFHHHSLDRHIPFRNSGGGEASLLPISLRFRTLVATRQTPAHQHSCMPCSAQDTASHTTPRPIINSHPL